MSTDSPARIDEFLPGGEGPLSAEGSNPDPDEDVIALFERDSDSGNDRSAEGDGTPPSNVDDGDTVTLSYIHEVRQPKMQPQDEYCRAHSISEYSEALDNAHPEEQPDAELPGVQPDAGQPAITSLLHIPYEIINECTFKPRKWLHFIATTLLGTEGRLRFIDEGEDITEQEMEQGVNPGDHLVFFPVGDTNIMDGFLRFRGHDQSTVTSRSRNVPGDLRALYGGCPFTKINPGACHAFHLISHVKGNEYLHRVLAARNVSPEDMTIDSHQNMLMMDARLHAGFDNIKHVAFLKTPNKFLKTNEIKVKVNADENADENTNENADPEEYRVTVHCFSIDERERNDFSNGAYSDLRRGSGSRRPLPTTQNDDVSHRPKDVLLDLAYAYALLVQWAPVSTKKKLQEDRKSFFYPNGMTKRGEYLHGEQEEEEKLRREQLSNEREEGANKRKRLNDEGDHPADEGGGGNSLWKRIYVMTCLARGYLPEEFEAEQERRRKEMEDRETERIAKWSEAVEVEQQNEYVRDAGYPRPCLNDVEDEKLVGIQEALRRSPPKYPIPAMPSLTFSHDTDPDNSVNLSAPGANDDNKQVMEVVQKGEKRSIGIWPRSQGN